MSSFDYDWSDSNFYDMMSHVSGAGDGIYGLHFFCRNANAELISFKDEPFPEKHEKLKHDGEHLYKPFTTITMKQTKYRFELNDTIQCRIKCDQTSAKLHFVNKLISPPQSSEEQAICSRNENQLLISLAKLLKLHSDVTFHVDGKKIFAHKNILSIQSTVLASMIVQDPRKKIEIADIEYDMFLELLRFVYVRKVDNVETLAQELLIVADRYLLEDLKNECVRILGETLNLERAFDYLKVADYYHLDNFKDRVINLVKKNVKTFVNMVQEV